MKKRLEAHTHCGKADNNGKRKICIVTLFGGGNYGTNFQAFALLYVLKSYGYDASVLECIPDPNGGKIKNAIKTALLYTGILQLLHRPRSRSLKQRRVYDFQKENCKIKKAFTMQRLKSIVEETDVFISGSDQVWNPYVFGTPAYFLSFAKDKKRISYASSIGVSSIPDEHKNRMRDFLMPYQHIGVREKIAVKVLSELTGRSDIVQVLDPTFLLAKEDWMQAAKGASLDLELPKHYIFAYFIAANTWYNEQIKDIAAKAGIKNIILVRGDNEQHDSFVDGAYAYNDGGPKEFLQLLNACDLVVTDSFHGTALSINFKKPFVELMRFKDSDPANQNSRVYDLLEHYGLKNQLYVKDSDNWLNLFNESNCAEVMTGGGQYTRVEALLNADRERSLRYLIDAIEK